MVCIYNSLQFYALSGSGGPNVFTPATRLAPSAIMEVDGFFGPGGFDLSSSF